MMATKNPAGGAGIDSPEFWALANAWASSTIDTPQRAASMIEFIKSNVIARARADAFDQAARLAIEWGNARMNDGGGNALRNYAQALRALLDDQNTAPRKTTPDLQPEECWSADEEDFTALSLGELIDRNDHLKPGMTVHVGQAHHPATNRLIDAADVIDQMADRAYDISTEYSDGYPDVGSQAKAELETMLSGWIEKHCPPTFYEVLNVKPYVLSADDFTSTEGETA